jgi:hypothetical protein
MNPVKFAAAAAFACGAVSVAASAASAMPIANVGLTPAPQIEDVAAVRVCNAYGHCWWRATGPYYYGYRRPYYGAYRYGWRRPYGYHYGWRHPYYHHYGYGFHGRYGGGWHRGFGGRGHWR